MSSYAAEADNGVIVSSFPNPNSLTPHIALTLSHLAWLDGAPVVIAARLSPYDARALAKSLADCAERVQKVYEEFEAEQVEGGGVIFEE